MYTFVSKHWHRFPQEIWDKLLQFNLHPTLNTGDIPTDFCIELARHAYDSERQIKQAELEGEISSAENEVEHFFMAWLTMGQVVGDEYHHEYLTRESVLSELREAMKSLYDDDTLTSSESAYAFLKDWHASAELNEEEARKYITLWFVTINDMSADLANSYIELLNMFFSSHNLRYIVVRSGESLEFKLNPGAIASERFAEVKGRHCDTPALASLYKDFEENFGGLLAHPTEANIKNTIGSSSHVVEALANKVTAKSGETLSRVLNDFLPTNVFPHEAAKESLAKLYKYYSDFPGIRHAGTAASATRSSSYRDAILFSSLSVLFADYLSSRSCPVCGAEMEMKDGEHGKFWGCTTFPKCRGSLSVLKAVP